MIQDFQSLIVHLQAFATKVFSVLSANINVKTYGAKGDGVTDDTAAIRAAFAAGVYTFPAGVYRFTDALTLKGGSEIENDIELRGAGENRTILHYDGTVSPAITVVGTGSHAQSIRVFDMTLRANPQYTGVGISITERWAYSTRFERVRFWDWRGTALKLNRGFLLGMRDCYFRACGLAFDLGGTQPGVDYVNAVYLDNVSVEFSPNTVEAVRVEQSRVFHWRGGTVEGNHAGVHLKWVANYSISNLYFEDNKTNAPWIDIERCGAGVIDNNFMPAQSGATMVRLQGRCLGEEVSTATISNNTFMNYNTPPVVLGTSHTQAYPPLMLNNMSHGQGARIAFVLLQPDIPTVEVFGNRIIRYDTQGNVTP